jgi:predicted dehydrogenase
MPAPVRVALLGFGLAGAAFHAEVLTRVPGLELAAVLTRDPGRREAAAARHPGVRLLDDAGQAFDPALAELVVVATPNRTHVPFALAALDAGQAVVVDKPVATSAAGVRELLDAGGLVVPFHNRRWDGDLLTLRRLMDDGRLGTVHRLESRFERFRPQVGAGWRELGDPAEGGGVLLDLGPHLVDQALTLLGPVESVAGHARRVRAGAQVDDDAVLVLEHASGAVSDLAMSAVAAAPAPRFRVLGTAGGWTKHGLDPQEDALRAGTPDAVAVEPPSTLSGPDGETPVPLQLGDYAAFYRGVRDAMRDGAPPPVALRDALAVAEVLDAVRAAGGA